jgi:ankyrin repeat protein
MGSGDVMIDAVEQNDYDRVKLLLDIGVSPDVDDEYGDPAISIATKKQHIDIVKLLVERGADVDQTDVIRETALMHAVWKRSPELVKILLEAGANVHLTDYHGNSVMSIAHDLNYQEIIDLIQASLQQ